MTEATYDSLAFRKFHDRNACDIYVYWDIEMRRYARIGCICQSRNDHLGSTPSRGWPDGGSDVSRQKDPEWGILGSSPKTMCLQHIHPY